MSRLEPARQAAAGVPLVRAEGLSKTFDVSAPWLNRVLEGRPRQRLHAVDDVSFDIREGETLALVGESGCGKSTVARMLVGLHRPTSGRVLYRGKEFAQMQAARQGSPESTRVQMIFQDPYASLNPRWNISDIVAEPIRARRILRGKRERLERVIELLQLVGLSAADASKYPHQFSGGQRQRVSIARALASQPEFLVCDEPTSALDVSVQAQVLNLMRDLQVRHGLTYLFISHNLAVVHHVSDRVGVMYLGSIVELSTRERVFGHPRHPYTRMLLDAIPDLAMSVRARTPVAGEVPNPLTPPSGCAFHPRCPYADIRCRAERPQLAADERGSVACHAVQEKRVDWA